MVSIATEPRPLPRRLLKKAKKALPKTLLVRALMIIVIPVVLLQIISTYVFYERHWDTVSGRLTRALVGEINMIIAWRTDFPGEENFAWIQEQARQAMDLSIRFQPGEILEREPFIRPLSTLDRMMNRALERDNTRPFYFDTRLDQEILVDIQLPDGVLEVRAPLRRVFSPSSYVFIIWMVGSALVLFGVATLFMHRQLEPIRRLAAIADNLGKGRDVPDFMPEGALEVRQAGHAFLKMRERLRRQVQQRTEMLAGVSHDLRTPLTRMKLSLAMMGDGPDIEELKADVAEMEKMIEGYLAFARGEGSEEPVPIDIAAMLEDIAAGARRNGSNVSLRYDGDLEAHARPTTMKRCLTNLVANATRFGSHVDIRARRRKKFIEITIDDDGPGIPEAQREDAFRPFYRLEQSRNKQTGGVGLGLTIARDVMRIHGGDLTLDDAPAGGLRAKVRLPV